MHKSVTLNITGILESDSTKAPKRSTTPIMVPTIKPTPTGHPVPNVVPTDKPTPRDDPLPKEDPINEHPSKSDDAF